MHTHLITQEDVVLFKQILDIYLMPIIGNPVLSGPFTDMEKPASPVVFLKENVIKIFMQDGVRIYFLMRKRTAFNASEKNLIARFAGNLYDTSHFHTHLQDEEEIVPTPVHSSRPLSGGASIGSAY